MIPEISAKGGAKSQLDGKWVKGEDEDTKGMVLGSFPPSAEPGHCSSHVSSLRHCQVFPCVGLMVLEGLKPPADPEDRDRGWNAQLNHGMAMEQSIPNPSASKLPLWCHKSKFD